MISPVAHQMLVPTDSRFILNDFPTLYEKLEPDSFYKTIYQNNRQKLYTEQQKLYADNRFSILLIFQAMDAAGKDSTIRHVLRGVNPSGFQVSSFKKPTQLELDHDFLWRSSLRLPSKGKIGVFNRSYYEEVLVTRVHPEYLKKQRLPSLDSKDTLPDLNFWHQRFHSINEYERHIANNGTVIRKFFLNVSRKEQHRRFNRRLTDPDKHWKFSPSDLKESEHWNAYMAAYQDCLHHTSTEWAPWYCIPADNKPAMRAIVSDIIVKTFQQLNLSYPALPADEEQRLQYYKDQLIV